MNVNDDTNLSFNPYELKRERDEPKIDIQAGDPPLKQISTTILAIQQLRGQGEDGAETLKKLGRSINPLVDQVQQIKITHLEGLQSIAVARSLSQSLENDAQRKKWL